MGTFILLSSAELLSHGFTVYPYTSYPLQITALPKLEHKRIYEDPENGAIVNTA